MPDLLRPQLRSVIEWVSPDPDLLFERWTEDGAEIKNASKLVVGPGQGCIFVYEGKVQATFQEEGLYELQTANIPFWTTIKSALYNFESAHKVAIHFFRRADMLNRRWGTLSPLVYTDPKYRFPVGLGAFGNFSFKIVDPTVFFRSVVAGAPVYPVREIQKVLVSRISQPLSDYLANAQFSYAEIDKHRNEIAQACRTASEGIFRDLGFELIDFRIEGTRFDDDTKQRIGRIADMTAEAQAMQALGIDYAKYQQLEAMRDLARNEGQGSAGMALGFGAAAGQMLGQQMVAPAAAPPPAPAAAPVVPAADDPAVKLAKLKKLFEGGLIDEAEYKAMKQEVLSKL